MYIVMVGTEIGLTRRGLVLCFGFSMYGEAATKVEHALETKVMHNYGICDPW